MAGSQDKHRIREHHGSVSDVPPESRPEQPPAPDSTQTRVIPPDREAPGPKERFVDRLWSFRAVIAVALASVILGGLGGAALASAGDDHDRRDSRFPGRMQQRPGGPMMPPGEGRRLQPPGSQQWQWGDGPGRRGMGQRQWKQEGPSQRFPSGVPTPKAKPTPPG